MKRIVIFLILITIVIGPFSITACDNTKQLIVDNKEIIKQVLIEIIDKIIDMIGHTPNASVSKSTLKFSPDYSKITVDIIDYNGDIIKTVQYDILKLYMKRMKE